MTLKRNDCGADTHTANDWWGNRKVRKVAFRQTRLFV